MPKKPEITISVSAPVWRARFTPFGEGLVTVGIPQLHRGDTSLALWALHDVAVPVHLYSGHTEGVYDFFWRSLHGVEFQLLSWSKDQTLRLWKTESNIVKQCGSAYLNHTIVLDHHTDSHYGKENLSTNSAVFSDGISPPHPITSSSPLDKELRSIDVANVVVEDIDVKLRSCTVFVTVGHHVAKIMMSFPLGYPEISCPNFFIAPETTLNPISLRQVTQMLTDVFNRCLKNQATSVAAGVRAISQFLGEHVLTRSCTLLNLALSVACRSGPKSSLEGFLAACALLVWWRLCGVGSMFQITIQALFFCRKLQVALFVTVF